MNFYLSKYFVEWLEDELNKTTLGSAVRSFLGEFPPENLNFNTAWLLFIFFRTFCR
jgi:hypothetical protein